ncbi:MAG: DNA primase, partial [Erythrobacter sp.]|nr:DNA primase [Erythrobacter sp.]
PSFTVNDDKGFYHCFGCQAHGDAISWMVEQRGLSFMDGVKELAARAGMDLPAPDPRAAERSRERAGLHEVTAAAQEHFVSVLHSDLGAPARDYLAGRGIQPDTARTFGFGFAPSDGRALGSALSGFDGSQLVEAGLLVEAQGKSSYARFRDRLTVPIQDSRGRVIGFGGRILEPREGVAKYLNSPDTPLFDKGRTLFNLHRAAPAARQAERLIVVEGYMDVVALAQAGFAEAVAPMGTALTEQQLELLWRQVERPVLCFDGDAAGQRAAARAIERALPLLRPDRSLAFATMPAGLDPDDLLRHRGPSAFADIVANARGLLDMLWETERGLVALDTPEAKAGLKARLLSHVDAIAHPDIRALYRRELLGRFSAYAFPPRPGRNNRPERPAAPGLATQTRNWLSARQTDGGDSLARAVLAGLAKFPELVPDHAEALSQWVRTAPAYRTTVEELIEIAERVDRSGDATISRTAELPDHRGAAVFSFLDERCDREAARADLDEAVALLIERPVLLEALDQATRRFAADPEGAFAEQQRLLKRKLAFEARLGQIGSRRAAFAASSISRGGETAALGNQDG